MGEKGTHGDKRLVIELDGESVEALEEGDDEGDDKSDVANVRLEGRLPGELVAADALDLERLHEADVGKEDRQPGQGAGHGNHRDEVGEDDLGSRGDGEVGDAADG